MEGMMKITVKWSGKEYEIELDENSTVAQFKCMIHRETGVRPDRQKLLNLKLKGKQTHPRVECGRLKFWLQASRRTTSAGWGTSS